MKNLHYQTIYIINSIVVYHEWNLVNLIINRHNSVCWRKDIYSQLTNIVDIAQSLCVVHPLINQITLSIQIAYQSHYYHSYSYTSKSIWNKKRSSGFSCYHVSKLLSVPSATFKGYNLSNSVPSWTDWELFLQRTFLSVSAISVLLVRDREESYYRKFLL